MGCYHVDPVSRISAHCQMHIVPNCAALFGWLRRLFILTTILLLLGSSRVGVQLAECSQDEDRLLRHLFKQRSYNSRVRPVKNHRDSVCVNINLGVLQLQTIVEKDQVMAIQCLVHMSWTDEQLTWNKDDFDNIDMVTVPADWIWLPDIAMYNNADGSYQITTMTKPWIYHNGTVSWRPPSIYKSSCRIDVTFFPFDQQICNMKLGPWTHDTNLVDMTSFSHADMNMLKKSGEWEIIGIPAQKHIISYEECCGAVAYADVTYYVILQRKPLFYTMTLIGPCVLISFLTVLVFYVPCEEGEKVTLAISVLLALTLFLLLIADIMPATSLVIPLIGKYLLFTLIIVTMSLIFSVVILNVHNRGPGNTKMPSWIRSVFIDAMPKFLLMKRPESGEEFVPIWERVGPNNGQPGRLYPRNINPLINLGEFDATNQLKKEKMKKAVDSVLYIAQHLKNEDDSSAEKDDWKFVAMVIDRSLLYTYIVMCVIGTVSIIFNSPAIYDPDSSQFRMDQMYDIRFNQHAADNTACPGLYWTKDETTGSDKSVIHRPLGWDTQTFYEDF
ncbi:acetylcholine receptor subunit alpha-like [Symsagittifera roscoffensis]|uniref:acetylcholine receptor subunit alpha-like n=1 Tax=Symsagittifera roscoffensis TaxID=84072 RepID=UPI00307CB2B2